MLYDFLLIPIYLYFCQYNIIYSVFQQEFAYYNETRLIIRQTDRQGDRETVCEWVYVRERERERERERARERENSEAFTSYFFFFLTLTEWVIC